MSISPSQSQTPPEKKSNVIEIKAPPKGVVHTDEEAQQVARIIYGVSTVIAILLIFLIVYFYIMKRKTKTLPK